MEGERGPLEGADAYEEALREEFGDAEPRLDLILLGLGPDMHTASLFPDDPALGVEGRCAVGVETPGMAPLVPRITLTLEAINAGHEVVFLIAGEDKADAVARRVRRRARPARAGEPRTPARGQPHAAARPRPRRRASDDGRRPVLEAQPVPADRGLRVPVRLRGVRARGARAAASSGCACRGWTRRRSSARSSTATPGHFRLGPADVSVPAARRYLPGTMVLETSWGTSERLDHRPRRPADRAVAPRDGALAHAPPLAHRLRRRPRPAADDPLRQRRGADQPGLRAGLRLRPRARRLGVHGRRLPRGRLPRARQRARRRAEADDRHEPRLRGAARDGADADQGGPDALLPRSAWSEHPAPQTYDEAYQRLVWTAHHWQHWLDRGQFPDHPWRAHLQRSALTLKGLSYAPTGAMLAAATTSLPETPGGERNWDYRYSWIRDSTFMLWGLYSLGFDWEANDFFYFIADVAEAEEGQLQIMYGIDGEAELVEKTLDHLSGYEGARPGPDRQRRLRPGPARRLGRRARLGLPPHEVARLAARAGRGRSSRSRSRPPSRTGATPTAGSGRSAASRSTSPRRSSCAGSRSTAARGWPRSARSSTSRRSGSRSRTRSRRTSARTARARTASSPSTTTPTRSTPQSC